MPGNPQNSNPKLCECDLANVVHSRARLPCFSSVSVQLFTAHCPASFFRAGIAILARKVTMEFCAILEMTQTARDLPLWPARMGEFSGTGVDFPVPIVFSVTQRPDGPRSTCRPRPDPFVCFIFPGPMEASPRLFSREMYWPRPPVSSWSLPHQYRVDRPGRL